MDNVPFTQPRKKNPPVKRSVIVALEQRVRKLEEKLTELLSEKKSTKAPARKKTAK